MANKVKNEFTAGKYRIKVKKQGQKQYSPLSYSQFFIIGTAFGM
jgi:hypothetical protein